MTVLPEKSFEFVFPIKNKIYTYEAFLQAVGSFPSFCGEHKKDQDAWEVCRKELATLFAHII